jgi:nucleotide-binding universal stress UspA family protein
MIPVIRKILYATDLSPNSAYAFRYAMSSANKHDAKIIILHVFESTTPAVFTQMVYLDDEKRKKVFDDRISYTLDRIKKRLGTFSDKELQDYPKAEDRIESIQVCEGFPADMILSKANELECDAIVMGTHGKGIIANTFLGSVTKRVLRRTRKPLFIIPLPKGEIDLTVHDELVSIQNRID